MRNGGETWYHCLDNENGIRSWAIVIMLLYAVFDIKLLSGEAFSQSSKLDGRIFEDKNPDIQNHGVSQGKGKLQDVRRPPGLQISSCGQGGDISTRNFFVNFFLTKLKTVKTRLINCPQIPRSHRDKLDDEILWAMISKSYIYMKGVYFMFENVDEFVAVFFSTVHLETTHW